LWQTVAYEARKMAACNPPLAGHIHPPADIMRTDVNPNPDDFHDDFGDIKGWGSWHYLQYTDMFNNSLPAEVKHNEWFGTTHSDYDDEDWPAFAAPADPCGWLTSDDGTWIDGYECRQTGTPTTVHKEDEGAETPVQHAVQRYYVGSDWSGQGRITATHTLQFYRGYGRQE